MVRYKQPGRASVREGGRGQTNHEGVKVKGRGRERGGVEENGNAEV